MFYPRNLNIFEKQLFTFHKNVIQNQNYNHIVQNIQQFTANLQQYYGYSAWKFILDQQNSHKIGSWFLAGGSVVGCINDNFSGNDSNSDVDFFSIKTTHSKFQTNVTNIIEKLQHKYNNITVITNGSYGIVINIYLQTQRQSLKLQFIYCTANLTPFIILHQFDLDCCQIGFTGTEILCTHAFTQAWNSRTMIHYSFRKKFNKKQIKRIKKYTKRGFHCIVPRITPNITPRRCKTNRDYYGLKMQLLQLIHHFNKQKFQRFQKSSDNQQLNNFTTQNLIELFKISTQTKTITYKN